MAGDVRFKRVSFDGPHWLRGTIYEQQYTRRWWYAIYNWFLNQLPERWRYPERFR